MRRPGEKLLNLVSGRLGRLGLRRVCRSQEPTSQAPKSGGWLSRLSGKPKAATGPAKGSREGYQTHTDEIRKKYGDKLV